MNQKTKATLVIIGCICVLQSCAFRPCTTMTANIGGVNSRLVGDSDSWTSAFGFQGGVEAHVPFNCTFPLTAWAGINVSMQGAGWEQDWGEGLFKGTTRLWYLNFPLTTRYKFGDSFYGEIGLQPGVLLSAKDNYEGESVNWNEYVKKFDLGIPLGVGYDFPNNFGVGLRVTPGVLNINAGEYADDNKDRNFVVALRGTYTFKGKDK